jgi:radical SAM protein with 4Fe4S-binding SPASM domain
MTLWEFHEKNASQNGSCSKCPIVEVCRGCPGSSINTIELYADKPIEEILLCFEVAAKQEADHA